MREEARTARTRGLDPKYRVGTSCRPRRARTISAQNPYVVAWDMKGATLSSAAESERVCVINCRLSATVNAMYNRPGMHITSTLMAATGEEAE